MTGFDANLSFEKAARLKLRFNYRGLCTVEDLWDLSLENLNSIYQKLNRGLKDHKEESLLDKKSHNEEILELTINIVKHIFETKQQESNARKDEAAKAERKQKLLGYIADKQDEKLRGMSIDELTKLVEEI